MQVKRLFSVVVSALVATVLVVSCGGESTRSESAPATQTVSTTTSSAAPATPSANFKSPADGKDMGGAASSAPGAGASKGETESSTLPTPTVSHGVIAPQKGKGGFGGPGDATPMVAPTGASSGVIAPQ